MQQENSSKYQEQQPVLDTASSGNNISQEKADTLGIVSMVTAFLIPPIGFIIGLIGAHQAKQENRSPSLSRIGWVIGLVSTLIIIIGIIVYTVMFMKIFDTANNNLSQLQKDIGKSQNTTSNNSISSRQDVDFQIGETANFGDYSVKINNVSRGYVPASSYSKAKDGNELIVLDLTVTNTSDRSQYVSNFDFDIEIDGLLERSSYAKPPGTELPSGSLLQNKSTSGQIVFEVPVNKQDLKLAKKGYVYDKQTYESKEVVYKLAF
jgi:hypothetical protein